MSNPLCVVLQSTQAVMQTSSHVKINEVALENEISAHADRYTEKALKEMAPSWEQDYHYLNKEDSEATATAILVLDALNFCFWPLEGYEYADLASGLKKAFTKDKSLLQAENLAKVDSKTLKSWLQRNNSKEEEIPLLSERVRLVNEIGISLLEHFGGKTTNLISACNYSASKLVALVTATFPGFRDHAIYNGSQVFFYKRAQIFVGDLWGAFQGTGLGRFDDIEEITCFADYRVPQILQSLNILEYSDDLNSMIKNHQVIPTGLEMEIQLRAATVQAVDRMAKHIRSTTNNNIPSIKLDWILWERGERLLATLPPHHRCLTIYY